MKDTAGNDYNDICYRCKSTACTCKSPIILGGVKIVVIVIESEALPVKDAQEVSEEILEQFKKDLVESWNK